MAKLKAFKITSSKEVLTPSLITTSTLGKYIKLMYSPEVSQELLYLNDKKGKGYHPGTKICNYFIQNKFTQEKYNSWYISKDSLAYEQIISRKFGTARDKTKTSIDKQLVNVIRGYTLDQVALWLSSIDTTKAVKEHLNILNTVFSTYAIKVKDNDKKNYFHEEKRRTTLLESGPKRRENNDELHKLIQHLTEAELIAQKLMMEDCENEN